MTTKMVLCILTIFLLISLLGCGPTKAYSGSTRSSDEVAEVRAWGVSLLSVNGIEIGSMSTGAVVLPGRNEFKFSVNSSNFNSREIDDKVYTLVMDAKPGKEYAITGKRGKGNVCAYEIQVQTGQPDFSKSAGCMTR